MCCIRNGGRAPNDTLALSCTTHSVALATIVVRAAAGVQLARQQAGRNQRDDDDDDQDDGQRVAEQVLDLHQQRRVLLRSFGLRARAVGVRGWPGGGPCGNCGGGGTCGAWLAGRAQGSVTSAILPYRCDLSGCACTAIVSRAFCAASRSMSVISSCGSAPADASTSPTADATRLPPTPVGPTAAISSPG